MYKASGELMKLKTLVGSGTRKTIMACFLLCCVIIFSATGVFAVEVDSIIPDTGQITSHAASGVTVLDATTAAPIKVDATAHTFTRTTTSTSSWVIDGFNVGEIFVTRGFPALDGNNGYFRITALTGKVATVTTLFTDDVFTLTTQNYTANTGLSFSHFGDDADYLINPPSYASGTGTVIDGITGLTWQLDDGTAYNWFQATGTPDDTSNPLGVDDVCGDLGMRLATIKELNQIAHYGMGTGLAIDNTKFTNVDSTTGAAGYWSATESGLTPADAMIMYFGTDSSRVEGLDKTEERYVMCVNDVAPLEPALAANGTTGTVSDDNIGLMWQKLDDNTQRNWKTAIASCEGLKLAGYSDWRLPNVKELQTIVDYELFDPAIDTAFFPGTNSVRYWTSTTDEFDTTRAWTVHFSDGAVLSSSKTNATFYTRCVRENQRDTTGPTVDITSGPSDPTSSTTATFTFTASEAGSTFQCRIDSIVDTDYAACTSPKTYTGRTGSPTGTAHTFDVRAKDPAGNTGAATSYPWVIDTTMPDLTITTLTVPATSGAGKLIDVTDTTKNIGNETTGETSTTSFYLSTNATLVVCTNPPINTIPAGCDPLLGSRAADVPVLGPGEFNTIKTTGLEIPSGTTTGNYYIIAKADAGDAVVEGNEESNNTKAALIKIGPDLTVTALTVSPTASGVGKHILVTHTTKNSGGGDAGISHIKYYLSPDAVLNTGGVTPDVPFVGGRIAEVALAAGVSTTLANTPAVDLIVPDVAAGSWYIIATADFNNEVVETNEINNTRAATIKIGPDLTVTALTVPTIGGAGQNINVTDTTKNVGGGDAGAASQTKYYLSANTTLNICADPPVEPCDKQLGAGRTIPAADLVAGASSVSPTITLTIPAGTATGSYYIIAMADADDAVDEAIENNNTRSAAIKIGPDLIISARTIPATATAGDIPVSVTVKNNGGGKTGNSTTGRSTIKYYQSTDAVLSNNDIELASSSVAMLNPGDTAVKTPTLTVPEGTWYIIVRVDANVDDPSVATGAGVIPETLETNNTSAARIVVGP